MKEIRTKIVGMQHVLGPNYSLILSTLTPGASLRLIHEQDNKADPNAVAVYSKNIKLGYLKKELAKKMTKKLYRTSAQVSKITGQNWGINILLSLDEFQDLMEKDKLKRGGRQMAENCITQ